MEQLDTIRLHFNQDSLLILNICVGFVMFGVALELTMDDFRKLGAQPKSLIVGLAAQFLLLPALTFLLVLLIDPWPSVALGMLLVASCPGGNISNFMSLLAKGNAALSVSLTAFSTLAALVMTPFNFAFWGKLYANTSDQLAPITLDPFAMAQTIVLVVGIPLLLGMWCATQYPNFTTKVKKPIKIISLVIFAGFIIGAFSANFNIFLQYIHLIMLVVLAHNAVAFVGGFYFGKAFSLPLADTKSIAIETGIQNSALALLLIFNFFDGLGGMAITAGWWGIWDIFSGLALAWLLARITEKTKVAS